MPTVVERLIRRSEFLRVAGSGKKWATPGLILQTRRRLNSLVGPRVGLTASRRVGNAVKRNRARRRLRNVATELLSKHGRHDHDYVVIARKGTMRRPYLELLHDLETALKRLKAWQND